MKTETRSRRSRWKIAACVLLAAVALAAAGFFWYVSDYYRADEITLEVLARDSGVTVQDDLTVLSPSYPTDTGLIFYPGAKVEGPPTCPCWTGSGRPASPASWWRCPSAWPSSMRTRRRT